MGRTPIGGVAEAGTGKDADVVATADMALERGHAIINLTRMTIPRDRIPHLWGKRRSAR